MGAPATLKYKKSLYKAEYGIWSNIKYRCFNPNSSHYKRYGGRGITMCQEWVKSFDAFMDDMGVRPSPKHSVDRINNDGNYEPGNCWWATYVEQERNKGLSIRNLTGHKGVSIFKRDNCYQAGIQVDGKWKYLGMFKTKEEAAMARKKAEDVFWKKVQQ